MPRRYVPTSGRVVKCSNCWAILTNSGRDGIDGRRYCSKKQECRAAKARYEREVKRRAYAVIEDRPCSECGRALPARPQRPTDRPEGRWCPDYRCRKAKRLFLQRGAAIQDAPTPRELFDEALANPGTCLECGRTDIAPGYLHPTPDMSAPCSGEEDDKIFLRAHRGVPPIDAAEITEIWGVQE